MTRSEVWVLLVAAERRSRDSVIDCVTIADTLLTEYDLRFDRELALTDVTASKQYRTAAAATDRELARAEAVAARRERKAGLASAGQARVQHVLRVLESTGGNKAAAAKILEISRRSLYRVLDRVHDHAGEPMTG